MHTNSQTLKKVACAVLAVCAYSTAFAGVTADEAAKLKTTLTPLGGEKAGNKDGTIPVWDGGTRFVESKDGRVPAAFADEKPLFTIDAKNLAKYEDKLADGIKALIKKYPETFNLQVYTTHRTASAPDWMYENTFKNATRATLKSASGGGYPAGAIGGLPFPIPKNGEEVMLNHLFRWQGTTVEAEAGAIRFLDGKPIRMTVGTRMVQLPYYDQSMTPEKLAADPVYKKYRVDNFAPPLRAGEKLVVQNNVDDDKSQTWQYLTGQRRVRKLPQVCCDTPNPMSGGIQNFDEVEGFYGGTGRYDWKLVGKREVYVPYNTNAFTRATLDEVAMKDHFNPKYVRWELHRVWVVEATLKAGQRHVFPTSRFYVDEDGVGVLIAERFDAQGKLAKVVHTTPTVIPGLPGVMLLADPSYDMLRGGYFAIMYNEGRGNKQFSLPGKQPDMKFTPDSITGEGVR
jgi:hypothetical protein